MNNYDLSGYDYDLYLLLGINKNATQDEIKTAYRNLSIKYHPDVNKDAGTEGRFKTINYAYQVLSCPEKREHYNKYLESGENGEKETPTGKESQGSNDGSKSQHEAESRTKTKKQQQGCGCITLLVLLVLSFFLIRVFYNNVIIPISCVIGTNCDHIEEVFINAILENNVKKAESLLDRYSILDKIRNDTVEEILIHSFENHDIELLKLLLDNVDPNQVLTDSGGDERSILYIAIERNNNEAVKLLLDNGANSNYLYTSAENVKLSILSYAVYQEKNEAIKLLLDKGADPNHIITDNEDEISVLDIAVHRDNTEIVKLLLDHGADPNLGLGTSLRIAINTKNKELTLLLLNNGADPNQIFTTEQGHKLPIVAFALVNENNELLKLLLDKGVDPNQLLTDSEGNELSMLAMLAASLHQSAGRNEALKLLIDKGADPNHIITDFKGNKLSLVSFAAINSNSTELVKLLLDNGACISKKDDIDSRPFNGISSRLRSLLLTLRDGPGSVHTGHWVCPD